HADLLVAYRENPHTDALATGERTALLLDRVLREGLRPVTRFRQPPLMYSPRGTASASAPMRTLLDHAAALEVAHPEILATSVLGGFAYADIADAGVSFTLSTTGDP